MSAVFFHTRGDLKTAGVQLSTTSATTIFSALDDAVEVGLIQIAEVGGSTPTLAIDIYDGAAVVTKIRASQAVTANSFEQITGPFILEPGWTLRATAGTADKLHVTATYLILKP